MPKSISTTKTNQCLNRWFEEKVYKQSELEAASGIQSNAFSHWKKNNKNFGIFALRKLIPHLKKKDAGDLVLCWVEDHLGPSEEDGEDFSGELIEELIFRIAAKITKPKNPQAAKMIEIIGEISDES